MKTVLILCLLFAFSTVSFAQYRYRKDVQKEQYERSFEFWQKKQPKVRIEAVKAAVEQSKDVRGERNKKSKLVARENRIRERIVNQ